MKRSINEEDIRRLYHDEGLSMREVASRVDVPLATLSRFMKKHGISSRSKEQAQKNYLRDNTHQMQGKSHTDETKKKISKSLGVFWDNLSHEDKEELRKKIGAAWRRKWQAMSEAEQKAFIEDLSSKQRAQAGKGSRLERFISEELQKRGYTVEERSTNYTAGKHFEVDLALPTERIAIEVDGPTHFRPIHGEEQLRQQQERDARKDEMIMSLGYSVLRIRDNNGPLSQVRIDRIEEAIKEINEHAEQSVWYIE